MLASVMAAFSMFSSIPMPQVEWNKKNLRYIICALPLIGLVVGACVFAWTWLAGFFSVPQILAGAVTTLIPVGITGGIHLDGFCDTADGLASKAPLEKKLEILKDSGAGAFAVIGLGCYLLAYFALAATFTFSVRGAAVFGLIFILSRALAGLAIAQFPHAKTSGLVHIFSDLGAMKATRNFLLCAIIFVCASMLFLHWQMGLLAVIAAGLCFLYYYRMAKKQFGGITGDLSGWFISMAELAMLAAIIAYQIATGGL